MTNLTDRHLGPFDHFHNFTSQFSVNPLSDGDGFCDNLQGTVSDIDGNTYETIEIGNQIWMAENLRVEHDNQGNDLPCYCYNNDLSNCPIYGMLYSWDTINSSNI